MGDTDFKVAGTRNSITALQVCFEQQQKKLFFVYDYLQADIKNMEGLPLNIVQEALQAARGYKRKTIRLVFFLKIIY
jgi:polyribonucleotide nucleotidyltransferase